MAVDACVASPTADSYNTSAELDAAMSLRDPNWAMRTEMQRDNIARIAAMDIDRLRFLGQPLYRGQGCAWPRRSDITVAQPPLTDLVPVTDVAQNVASDPGIVTPTDITFTFPDALVPGATGRPCTLSAMVDGVAQVFVDSDGSGVAGAATINYADGIVTIPGTAVDPATTSATWVQAPQALTDKFSSASFVLDSTEYLPDVYKGGSVHAVVGGTRMYLNVTAHDIVNGVVTTDEAVPVDGDAYIFHYPLLTALKEAQLAQMCKLLNVGASDPLAGTGIKKIKVGDSERQYDTSNYGSQTVQMLAARNRVDEQVIVLLGAYTVYGKLNLLTQEAEDTAYER